MQTSRRCRTALRHRSLAVGLRGEMLISDAVNGELADSLAAFDLSLPSGARVEVKTSSLHHPAPNSSTWSKILGQGRPKQFDWLVLIGDVDARYRRAYRDPEAEYVLFVVRRSDVDRLLIGRTLGRRICLSTNPARVRSPIARTLFKHHQATRADLAARLEIA